MPKPETVYSIPANISEFEWHVIQHLRKLAAHGFGELQVVYVHHQAKQCRVTLNDDPDKLKTLQE